MTEPILGPQKNPCGSCPYRRDTPPGLWAEEEYLKLPAYDLPTPHQPPSVFLCHQQDGHLCAGWVGCHDMDESLGVRLAALRGQLSPDVLDEVLTYSSPVPLYASGSEACRAGMAGVRNPSPAARRMMARLTRKLSRP